MTEYYKNIDAERTYEHYAEEVIRKYIRKRSRLSMVEMQRELILAHRPYMNKEDRNRADSTLEFLTDVLLGVKEYGTNVRRLI